MSRIFPNFLEAFTDYQDDKFCPPQFLTWCGLSIIAGALERKCWLPWNDKYSFYPNIYVLLVSKPGVGKSVALDGAVDLLMEMNRKTSSINIMPNQVTEAKFLELMGTGRSFVDRSGGRELTVFQNAGYYFASEASESLRNIFGEFIACLTKFYDCPVHWKRASKSSGELTLKNVCMNLIAASTFDYLGKLVSDENIQGGFASRLLYVVHDEMTIRHQKFQGGGMTDETRTLRREYRTALVNDLADINRITGPMHADPEFGAAWEKWFPEFEKRRQAFESEKLQSILARTNTSVLKVAMLLSAAESSDRVLRLRHWEKAVSLVEGLNQHIPTIFREAKASQPVGKGGGGTNLTHYIVKTVLGKPNITQAQLQAMASIQGHSGHTVAGVIQSLVVDGMLASTSAIAGSGISLIVKGDPNKYL